MDYGYFRPTQPIFQSSMPAGVNQEDYARMHSGRILGDEVINQTALLISDFNEVMSQIKQLPKMPLEQLNQDRRYLQLLDRFTQIIEQLNENKRQLKARLSQINYQMNPTKWFDKDRNQQKIIINGLLKQISDVIKSQISIGRQIPGTNQYELVDNFGNFIFNIGEGFSRILILLIQTGFSGGKRKTCKTKKSKKTRNNNKRVKRRGTRRH